MTYVHWNSEDAKIRYGSVDAVGAKCKKKNLM